MSLEPSSNILRLDVSPGGSDPGPEKPQVLYKAVKVRNLKKSVPYMFV